MSIYLFYISSILSYAQSPFASFTPSDTLGCAPFTVSFANTSTDAYFFFWEFGDGTYSNQQNPTHTYYSNDDFTVALWADDSLGNYDSAYAVIHVPEDAPFFALPAQACPGQVIPFTVYGNFNPANQITWSTGDGFLSNASFFEHAYSSPDVYPVWLEVNNPVCGTVIDSGVISVETNITPPIHIHPEWGDTVICPGGRFPFFYDELLPIQWDFGDGNFSTDPYPEHYYTAAGTYTVTATVTNQCGNSSALDTVIHVNASAKPKGNIYVPQNVFCTDEPVVFTASGNSWYDYQWIFGDGDSAAGQKVIHAYNDTGIYSVQLIAENICGNSAAKTKMIFIYDTLTPTPGISISPGVSCPGDLVRFSTSPDYKSVLWDFGDGNTSQDFLAYHSYASAGIYAVQLQVTNFCNLSGLVTDTVAITDSIVPLINFSTEKLVYCPGETVRFRLSDTATIYYCLWNFGDGFSDSAKNPFHTYSDTGNYLVTVVIKNSCGIYDTVTRPLSVNTVSLPVANYTVAEGFFACTGNALNFLNFSSDTSQCEWDFGDGNTSSLADPVHTYAQSGNYLVKLQVINSCGQEGIITRTVTVSGKFMLPPPTLTCYSSNDTLAVSWEPVPGATGYEASTDGGVSWLQPAGPGLSHYVISNEDSLIFLVRALGSEACRTGDVPEPAVCLKNFIPVYSPDADFTVFPVPVTNFLNIGMPSLPFRQAGLAGMASLKIYSIYGKLMYSENISSDPSGKQRSSVKLDFRNYPDGFYFLEIMTKSGSAYFKILHGM